jgi:hypothetical protein
MKKSVRMSAWFNLPQALYWAGENVRAERLAFGCSGETAVLPIFVLKIEGLRA